MSSNVWPFTKRLPGRWFNDHGDAYIPPDSQEKNPYWSFTKPPYKQGYINNPNWTENPAHTNKHHPCGYWIPGTYTIPARHTSKPYPIEHQDLIDSPPVSIVSGILRELKHNYGYLEDLESPPITIIAGELRAVLLYYDNGEPDELESSSATIISGELELAFILKEYEGDAEELESSSATILSGSLQDVLIHYTNGDVDDEELESYSATIVGGNLE